MDLAYSDRSSPEAKKTRYFSGPAGGVSYTTGSWTGRVDAINPLGFSLQLRESDEKSRQTPQRNIHRAA